MEYVIGQRIITGGRSPEDHPEIGEVRPIVDGASGMALAWYRVTEVIVPAVKGWLAMIHGEICEEPKR